MNRSRLLLLLFVLLGLSLFYAWKETPRQRQIVNGENPAVINIPEETSEIQVEEGGGLDFSGGEKLPFRQPKRDLFRALYNKPVPVIVEEPEPVTEPVPEPQPVPVTKPAPVIVKQPPVPLNRPAALPEPGLKPIPAMKVLGSLQKGQSQTAFLSSPEGEIYVVKQGDRFADGILVRELTKKNIVLSRGQGDRGLTLSLLDEKSASDGKVPVMRQPSGPARNDMPFINSVKPQSPMPLIRPLTETGVDTVDP